MDALLPSASSPLSKRPCPNDPSSSSSSVPRVSPCSAASAMDGLLECFVAGALDPSVSLHLSLERLLGAAVLEHEKEALVAAAARAGSALLDAAGRSARKRASLHNAAAWPLPPDLTIRVFAMLDTRSLCHASATCSLFNKCATDSLCYTDIDLTAVVPRFTNTVVSTMIQRAGKNLRSLKLGRWPSPSSKASHYTLCPKDSPGLSSDETRPSQMRESSVLSRSCLAALSLDGGAAGALLRKLYLYNIDKMNNAALCLALKACQSLADLKLVGLPVELRQTLTAISKYCCLIERLFIESSDIGRDDGLKSSTCSDLVKGCPNISSLSLRGFKLHDHKVSILVKILNLFLLQYRLYLKERVLVLQGLCNLKYVDFSTSLSITGTFLRNLGSGTDTFALEALILRDCLHLKEVEVSRFFSAVLDGDCKQLRYVDVSNKDGLSAHVDWNERCFSLSTIPISRLSKERPEICLIAEFPSEGSCSSMDIGHASDSETSSDVSLPLSIDVSLSASSSESIYSSDLGSGNEDAHGANAPFYYVDGFDEADLPLF
ncbi:F-box protein SKIP17-like isoform X2 [Ananas comosus]|uniref:F-box protein SKIP17-like isoform X2 n=1 Tax=Ananas comosus TaxID=4615 RepID=A0A6P5G147_ANACO|nr:F-box protein SKIP17-like isoform X2 [Ananas comosus]